MPTDTVQPPKPSETTLTRPNGRASGATGRPSSGDLWGGLAATMVALPSSIAFGISVYGLTGARGVALGVQAGLAGAVALGLVASLLGGAPRLISAPCAPAAAVLAAFAADMAARGAGGAPASLERVASMVMAVTLLCGLFQFVIGRAGGGRLIKYIPYPVIAGYLSAVGLSIFVSQTPKLLGAARGTFWAAVIGFDTWRRVPIVVGSVTIAVVLAAPKITKAIPAAILGLLAGTAAYFCFAWFDPALMTLEHNNLVIGTLGGADSIFSGLSRWGCVRAFGESEWLAILTPALTLSILLCVDTMKTCVIMDALTLSRHDSDRELRAQGMGNAASALLGGLAGSGTVGATLVNLDSGGKSRWSGVAEGVFVLLAFALLGRWIAWLPLSALAGILLVVACRMFDWRSFRLAFNTSTLLDFCVIAAVVCAAARFSLIAAAGTGVALTVVLFIRDQIRSSVVRRKMTGAQMFSTQWRLPSEQKTLSEYGSLTTICQLQGTLFFGTTDQLSNELKSDLDHCQYLILDMRRIVSVDYTAAHLLRQFEALLARRGGYLIFCHLSLNLPGGLDLQTYFAQVGLTSGKQNARKFETLDDALRWAEDRILDEHGSRRGGHERVLRLNETELFKDFKDPEALAAFAKIVEEQSFAAGESIFKCGDAGDHLYVIRRGIVRITLSLEGGKYHNLASFSRGDFFGELAFLDCGVRSANAIATEAVDLFVISRARFDQVVNSHPLIASKILTPLARVLASRLRRANAEVMVLHES